MGTKLRNWFLLWAFVASFAVVSQGRAHWDGDPTKDGHYYAWTLTGSFFATPKEAFDDWIAIQGYVSCADPTVVDYPGWGKQWEGQYALSNCPMSTGNGYKGGERHCAVGSTFQGTACAVGGGECAAYDGDQVVYTGDAAGALWVNEEGCYYQRIASSANASCFDLTYENTGWQEVDDNYFSWINSLITGDIIGPAPEACTGHDAPVWSGAGAGGGGGEACVVGYEVFAQYPYMDVSDFTDPQTLCASNSCEIIGTASICLGNPGEGNLCGGDFTQNGQSCGYTDGTGAGETTNDNATEGGNAGVNMAGVESRLDTIADLIECDPLTDPRCVTDDQPAVGTAQTMDQTVQDVYTRIENAPLVQALSGIGSSIPAGACPTGTTDPIEPLGGTVLTFDAHCVIWQEFDDVLHAFMLTVWSLIGVGIIFRA